MLLLNGIASVACFALLAALQPGVPAVAIALILYLSGALRSIGFTAYNSLAFSDVDGEDLTHANTLNASVQELAAGLGIAVADAHPLVLARADLVTRLGGGVGAVREVCDLILQAQGLGDYQPEASV